MLLKNKKLIISLSFVFLVIILLALCLFYKKANSLQSLNKPEQKTEDASNTVNSTLDDINKFQKRYFDIVKRHDMFLALNNDEDVKNDYKELKELYEEVEGKLEGNSEFFARYKDIENRYKENNGETTLEMNTIASNNYEETDKLLNDVYKEVKLSIGEEEFNKLKLSQRAWLKEVEAYNSVFEKQGFVTIAALVKLGYEVNMRSFRTLLLMLYLNKDNNISNIDDFLGQWSEVNAGRIYVEIKKKGKKIEVEYGGANSAYSHSVSQFDCDYDRASYGLICLGAKHTDQFLSCGGYSSDDNMEEFMNCSDKNPDLTKEDYKTYTDNEKRILKIKKGTNTHFIIDDDEYMDEDRKKEIREKYYNMGLYFDNDKDLVFYKYRD